MANDQNGNQETLPLNPNPGMPVDNRTFSITYQHLGRLRDAIEVLCNLDLNPNDFALIEVGQAPNASFKISVYNPYTGVKALLYLQASNFIEFRYTQPFENQYVMLRDILQLLSLYQGHVDPLTIYHIVGSTQLVFELGVGSGGYAVGLLDRRYIESLSRSLFAKFPRHIVSGCFADLRIEYLREIVPPMAELTTTGLPRQVTMCISETTIITTIGEEGFAAINLKDPRKKWLSEGQRHCAVFTWINAECLLMSANLVSSFSVQFTGLPSNCILFRFDVEGLGVLFFIKRSIQTIFDY